MKSLGTRRPGIGQPGNLDKLGVWDGEPLAHPLVSREIRSVTLVVKPPLGLPPRKAGCSWREIGKDLGASVGTNQSAAQKRSEDPTANLPSRDIDLSQEAVQKTPLTGLVQLPDSVVGLDRSRGVRETVVCWLPRTWGEALVQGQKTPLFLW